MLIVSFPGACVLEQQPHLERGGLFLPSVDPMPEAQAALTIRVCSPYGQAVELETQVVQVFPGTGFALTLAELPRAKQVFERLFRAAQSEAGEAGPVQLSWAEAGAKPVATSSEPEGTLFDRIRAMSTRERMQLARHGDRASRAILMKDTTKTIHVFLVQNKGLTADEVRYFASLRQANPEALEIIARDRTWTQKTAIVSALVHNPKTPSRTAVRLLEKLPRAELARIAKTGNAPRAVVEAAKKKINAKRR